MEVLDKDNQVISKDNKTPPNTSESSSQLPVKATQGGRLRRYSVRLIQALLGLLILFWMGWTAQSPDIQAKVLEAFGMG
jgi:hypothetical protein